MEITMNRLMTLLFGIILVMGLVSCSKTNQNDRLAGQTLGGSNTNPGSEREVSASSGYTQATEKLKALGFAIPSSKMKAPNFTATDLEGNKVSLKSQRGKIVFLNYWATWCMPCVREMPSMEKLNNKLKGLSFAMMVVSNEKASRVKSFIEDKSLTLPVFIGSAALKYGVQGIPTTFIIGKKGELLGKKVGGAEWQETKYVELFKFLANSKI